MHFGLLTDIVWRMYTLHCFNVLRTIGDTEDVNLFSEQVSSRGRAVPGLPKFDPNRVVRILLNTDAPVVRKHVILI